MAEASTTAATGIRIGGKLVAGIASIWGGQIAGKLINDGFQDLSVTVAGPVEPTADSKASGSVPALVAGPKVDP